VAKRTYATSSIWRKTAHDQIAISSPGTSAVVFAGHLSTMSSTRFSMTCGLIGPFLAGFFEAGQKFLVGKLLAPSIALDDHQRLTLDFLVSGEAMPQQGIPDGDDGRPFTGGTRIITLSSCDHHWTAHNGLPQ